MLKYWLWLVSRRGIGPRTLLEILTYFGTPEAAYFADPAEYALVPELTKAQQQALLEKDLHEPERILEECSQKRIRILTYQDAAYPERLRAIADPPLVLYYQGRIPDVDNTPTIGVVGARSATAYGLLQAKKFGYQLGSCGAIVVSGMARGIDTLSLEGALTAGSPVIGVLGCGVDRVYPPENRSLYRDVAAYGCLISEYPPGTPPEGRNFPIRNRIISGLSVGVLVVEASAKSGALITAARALDQGRDVFAVPSNLGVDVGEGTNRLIRDGAILATCGWDVLREYTAIFPDKILPQGKADNLSLLPRDLKRSGEISEKRSGSASAVPADSVKNSVDNPPGKSYIDLNEVRQTLTPDELALAQLLSPQPVHIDELIESSQLPASAALAALTLLELKHVALRLPGRRYRLAEKKTD